MAHDIAERIARAHAARRQFASSELSAPADAAEVYRIQDQVYARLAPGARPSAWKVGGPSADVEPTIAPILPGRVLASPASVNARDFHVIGVEAEITFRITDATPQAVVAIELCDSRLADWQSASALWKLADNQMNWGLVLGTGTARWQEIDFAAQGAELWIGGDQRVAVRGAHPYGNPFRLITWTERHLGERAAGLQMGDVVTTGSWGGMHFARAGDEVIARFPGIGEAIVRIA
jgi:2-keto-4-pentenoate hydratase